MFESQDSTCCARISQCKIRYHKKGVANQRNWFAQSFHETKKTVNRKCAYFKRSNILPHEESGSRVPPLRGSKCGFKRYSILKVKLIFRQRNFLKAINAKQVSRLQTTYIMDGQSKIINVFFVGRFSQVSLCPQIDVHKTLSHFKNKSHIQVKMLSYFYRKVWPNKKDYYCCLYTFEY